MENIFKSKLLIKKVFIFTLMGIFFFLISCDIPNSSKTNKINEKEIIETKIEKKQNVYDFVDIEPKDVTIYSGQTANIKITEKINGFLKENLIAIKEESTPIISRYNFSYFDIENKDNSYILTSNKNLYQDTSLTLFFKEFDSITIPIRLKESTIDELDFISKPETLKVGQKLILKAKAKFNFQSEFQELQLNTHITYKNLTPEIIKLNNDNSITTLKTGIAKISLKDNKGKIERFLEIKIINDILPNLKDKIIFQSTLNGVKGLYSVDPYEQNKIELLFPSENDFISPEVNADGKTILFSSKTIDQEQFFKVYTIQSNGKNLRRITPPLWGDFKTCTWSPDSKKVLCSNSDNILSIIDLQTEKFDIILDNMLINLPKWTSDSKKVYFSGIKENTYESYILDLESKELKILNPSNEKIENLTLTDNNSKIIFTYNKSIYSIPIYGQEKKLIKENVFSYCLSGNGKKIVYSDYNNGDLYIMNIDSSEINPLNIKIENGYANFTWSKY